MNRFFVFLTIVLFAGCSATSHIMVGEARVPVNRANVKVYMQAPNKYEVIALLESSSKYSFAITEQGKTDAVLEELKLEAAKLGANGLLLSSVNDEQVLVPVQNANGSVSHYSSSNKVIKTTAIYVVSE